jgi:hypothetical protein
MAYLYRFSVQLEKKEIAAVILAENDEAAFRQLDIELEKFYLKEPGVQEVALREKKRAAKTAGFIFDEDEKGW